MSDRRQMDSGSHCCSNFVVGIRLAVVGGLEKELGDGSLGLVAMVDNIRVAIRTAVHARRCILLLGVRRRRTRLQRRRGLAALLEPC